MRTGVRLKCTDLSMIIEQYSMHLNLTPGSRRTGVRLKCTHLGMINERCSMHLNLTPSKMHRFKQ